MEGWIQEALELREPFAKMFVTILTRSSTPLIPSLCRTWTDVKYPLPSSFPRIFNLSSQSTELYPSHGAGHQCLDSVPIYSALRSSTTLYAYFDQHYRFIDTLIHGGVNLRFLNPGGMVGGDGIGKDELREAKETILKLKDGISAEDVSGSGDGPYDEVGYDIY